MTPQEEVDLVNTLLEQAGSNGGVAEWQEGAHKVKHYSLRELLAWKREAEERLYQSSHRITMPVREVNL
jgi:hypothetical protein